MKRYHKIGDKVKINYRKKRILVTVIVAISGHDLVAVDKDGRIYTTWWQDCTKKLNGKMPLSLRHWRRFQKGLYYLKRGLVHAIIETEDVKIPTISQLQEFCRQTGAELDLLEGSTADKLESLSQIGQQFLQLQRFLDGKKRHTYQSAQTQLHFLLLLYDSKGRLNIGVLRARLSTIDQRFSEELKNLTGWLPHYAGRLSAIKNIQQQFERNIKDVNRSLSVLTTHRAFTEGKTTPKQTTGLINCLARQIFFLAQIRNLRPFSRWADHCTVEIKNASKFIARGMFFEALNILRITIESTRLRISGFKLESLISDFSLEFALNKNGLDIAGYKNRIDALANEFSQIGDEGFLQPVCKDHIIARLQIASGFLEQNNLTAAKDWLKKAADPI